MMNWPLAITRNRDALLRIVAALFAMAGISTDPVLGLDPRMPRHLRNAVLSILRPAESAVRRLIVIAARGLVVVVVPARRKRTATPSTTTTTSVPAIPSLPLLDPKKRFPARPPRRRPKAFPRICVIGVSEPRPIPDGWIPSPDDAMDAAPLCRRLHALRRALDDLDGHAMRLARWKARRDLGLTRRFHPMRPGRPPGHRKRPVHEVDDVLRECHSLAHDAQREDTS